jgi:hypothetical protein
MSYVINTYNLFISSTKRTAGDSNAFQTSLYKTIGLTSPNNWFTVRVGSAEIPYVFTLINPDNSTVNFTLIRNAVTYNGSVTLTSGNYNILTLLSELKSKLVTAITSLSAWDPSQALSFTYDRSSGKATFSLQGSDSVATSLTILDNSPVFLRCVGFTTSFTFSYTTPILRVNAISSQNVNVSQNTAVYIRSDSLVQSTNIENIVVDNEVSNILAKIQINASPQSYILWTNPVDLETKINNRAIDTVSVYLGSSTAYKLDLGNLDWSLRLTIKEWTKDHTQQDLAVNMVPPAPQLSQEGLQNLMDERDKAVRKLMKLRDKINSRITVNETEAETSPERQDLRGGAEAQTAS